VSVPFVHDSGEGEPLLLLHAYPLDASQWDAQVAALSGRYRCLRPDFWGCGASPAPPSPATIDGWAATLLAELDRLGVDRFSVCGISVGGYTAFALYRVAPGRVRSLVLTNTRAAADDEPTRAGRAAQADQVRAAGVESLVEPMVSRLLCPYCQEEAHITDPVRGRIRRCTTAGVLAAIELIGGRPDSTPMLATIAVPTMVVCGTADVIVPVAESRAMAAEIPGAVLHEVAGAAHLANLEQPLLFSTLLGDFLASV
jgi:3-oxoadipate enol-lactonase